MLSRLAAAAARVPIVGSLGRFSGPRRRADLFAGAAVLSVLVPQALAYGSVAELPPVNGLYAATAAMLGFSLFSRGRVMVGPESTSAAMSAAAIGAIVAHHPGQALELSATLAVLVGAACFVISLCRLGFATELLSRPVLFGYLAGVSIVVITGQLPKLFGIPSQGGNVVAILWHLVADIGSTSLVTLGFGTALLAGNLLLGRTKLPVPGPLVVIVVATLATAVFHLDRHGIAVIGHVPRGLPAPRLPIFRLSVLRELVLTALGIAFVIFADSSALGRSFATAHGEEYVVDGEIASLGVANVASGFFGGFVVGSSGSRTAIADATGMAGQVAQLVAALGAAVVLVGLTPLLTYLPVVALAAIVIGATLKLLAPRELMKLWRGWHSEALLAVITLVAVAMLGVLAGLGIAILLALLNLVRISARPHDAVLALDRAELVYRDSARLDDPSFEPGLIIYRPDAPLFFANIAFVRERVTALVDRADEPVHCLVLDCEATFYVDSTATAVLAQLCDEFAGRGIRVVIARMKAPVRARIELTELATRIGPRDFFPSVRAAVRVFREAAGETDAIPPAADEGDGVDEIADESI